MSPVVEEGEEDNEDERQMQKDGNEITLLQSVRDLKSMTIMTDEVQDQIIHPKILESWNLILQLLASEISEISTSFISGLLIVTHLDLSSEELTQSFQYLGVDTVMQFLLFGAAVGFASFQLKIDSLKILESYLSVTGIGPVLVVYMVCVCLVSRPGGMPDPAE